jgi:hypothetical protein
MMVGRSIDQLFPKGNALIGEIVLEARNLSKIGVFKDVSCSVTSGGGFLDFLAWLELGDRRSCGHDWDRSFGQRRNNNGEPPHVALKAPRIP